jgi:PncC family amidohydrolase
MQAYVFAEEDITLQEAVGRLFQAKGKTFAVAESCTGGYVGHLVTSIPGSSVYFKGSLVTYSYSMKEAILGVKKETLETQGAVSEACVHEMLEGLLRVSDADYGVAISGIAGPDGGTAAKPVGTVCFAVGFEGEHKDLYFTVFPIAYGEHPRIGYDGSKSIAQSNYLVELIILAARKHKERCPSG